jgi:Protein of unknown function (DUF4230)
MNKLALALVPLCGVSFGAGYYLAPKEQLATEVEQDGFFRIEEATVLSATVESLRAENSLVVWSYKGTATVTVSREDFYIFESTQRLIVPAKVDYRLPLNDLTLADVEFNETAKLVTVRLPRLKMGDVVFQPEAATTINGGLLTMDDDVVQALGRKAYRTARRAVVRQAQQTDMRELAQREASEAVERFFKIPLRIAGHPDIEVVATFD